MIALHSGKIVDLDNLRVNDIDIEDIAHSLSMICRFNGHTSEFYSVAQHSILVALISPDDLKLDGLLHDATEMLIGDIIRPIKHLFKDYIALENRLWSTIASRYGLNDPMDPRIDFADKTALKAELKRFMPNGHEIANSAFAAYPDISFHIESWNHEVVKTLFLEKFNRYFWNKK